MKKYTSIILIILILMLTSCQYSENSNSSDSSETGSVAFSATGESTVIETSTITSEPSHSVTSGTTSELHNETTESHLASETSGSTDKSEPVTKETTTKRTPIFKNKEFFDDCVFVGDSISLGLKLYVDSQRSKGNECLGKAEFLCCGSMSFANALLPVSDKSLHPTYQGQKVSVEDGIQRSGAKKVFLMLGMNDFSGYNESAWKKNVVELIERIRDKNPNVTIYIESVTPILSGMEHGGFTNENIRNFNDYLKSICKEYHFKYVDLYNKVMIDNSGYLNPSYCGDAKGMGIHMSFTGAEAWVSYLTDTYCR